MLQLSEQKSVTKGSVSNLQSKFDLKNYLTLIWFPPTPPLPLSGGAIRKSLEKYVCKCSEISLVKKSSEWARYSFMLAIENTDHKRGLKRSRKPLILYRS